MQTRKEQKKHEVITVGNIRFAGLLHNFTICTIASSIIGSSIVAPIYAYEAQARAVEINFNDIALISRLEKLYEKAKRYIDKLDNGKLMEVMFDIKTEVEGYTNKKIDLDAHIDAIEREAKKQGAQFKKGEIKQIKKELNRKGKKHNHRAMFLYECNLHDIEFNQDQCDLDFDLLLARKASKDHHGKEDDKEIKVPIRVSIGITASLCGYFLSFIPHPIAQGASKFLIATGVGLCVDGTVTRIEENEKEEQNGQARK